MSDTIPKAIFTAIKEWCFETQAGKAPPCKIELHVNGEGKIVQADRVVKDRVTAN